MTSTIKNRRKIFEKCLTVNFEYVIIETRKEVNKLLTVDDVFRAAIDKLKELAKESVNSIAELIEQYFKEWLVEEFQTLKDFAKEMEKILEEFEEYYKGKERQRKILSI